MTKWRSLGLFLFLAGAAFGADVTGKWTGSLDLDNGNHGGAYVALNKRAP